MRVEEKVPVTRISRVSDMRSASSVDDDMLLFVVQNGIGKKTTWNMLKNDILPVIELSSSNVEKNAALSVKNVDEKIQKLESNFISAVGKLSLDEILKKENADKYELLQIIEKNQNETASKFSNVNEQFEKTNNNFNIQLSNLQNIQYDNRTKQHEIEKTLNELNLQTKNAFKCVQHVNSGVSQLSTSQDMLSQKYEAISSNLQKLSCNQSRIEQFDEKLSSLAEKTTNLSASTIAIAEQQKEISSSILEFLNTKLAERDNFNQDKINSLSSLNSTLFEKIDALSSDILQVKSTTNNVVVQEVDTDKIKSELSTLFDKNYNDISATVKGLSSQVENVKEMLQAVVKQIVSIVEKTK